MYTELSAIAPVASAQALAPILAHVAVPPLARLDPDLPVNFCRHVPLSSPAHADQVCLIEPDSGRSVSYADLHERVRRARGFLARQGVQAGAVVAVLAEDSIDVAAVMLACFWSGAVFAPLNYTLAPAAIERMVEQVAPSLLLFDPAVAPQYAEGAARHRLAVCLDTAPAPVAEPAALHVDALAVILFSSGSTGSPKPVPHSHGDLIHTNLNYVPAVLGLRPGERIFSPSRMFFAYGLNAVLFALFAGNSCVLAGHPSRRLQIIELLRTYEVNIFFSVPTVFKFMLQDAGAGRCALPALRLCVSAGEALPPALHASIRARLGIEVLDGIGTTEVLSTFISNRIGDAPGGTGAVVPGFEVKLVGQDGTPCRSGEIGTLWVRGLTVAPGYLDSAADGFQDGWYNSKDMFTMDGGQRFHYFGRGNDVVKINGCWFSPHVIEQVLQEHAGVRECEIVFLADELGLMRPHANIVLNDPQAGADALWSELRQLSKTRLGEQMYPHFFRQVDSLPRTSSGKLLRGRLNAGGRP